MTAAHVHRFCFVTVVLSSTKVLNFSSMTNFVLRAEPWGGQCCLHGWERKAVWVCDRRKELYSRCLCLTWSQGCLLRCWFLLQSGQPSTEILLSTEQGSPPSPWAPPDYQTSATEHKTSSSTTAGWHWHKYHNSFERVPKYQEHLGVVKGWEGFIQYFISKGVSDMVSEKTM